MWIPLFKVSSYRVDATHIQSVYEMNVFTDATVERARRRASVSRLPDGCAQTVALPAEPVLHRHRPADRLPEREQHDREAQSSRQLRYTMNYLLLYSILCLLMLSNAFHPNYSVV